jgi:hypothetical protein
MLNRNDLNESTPHLKFIGIARYMLHATKEGSMLLASWDLSPCLSIIYDD